MNLKRYPGKVVLAKIDLWPVRLDWDLNGLPDELDVYGVEWTGCDDATIHQLREIKSRGVLVILDHRIGVKGNRHVMLSWAMAGVPMVSDVRKPDEDALRRLKPLLFKRGYYGQIEFGRWGKDPCAWTPRRPRYARVRFDLIGTPRVAQKV